MVPLITQGVMAEHGCKGTTFSYNQEFLIFCHHFATPETSMNRGFVALVAKVATKNQNSRARVRARFGKEETKILHYECKLRKK